MSVTYARGWRKNLALTVWLLLPFAVVGGLVFGIFIAYRDGPAMDARPVGQGAGDTGGANALGQWLAGRSPDEVQRIRRDLREGRLIDPVGWPDGVRLFVSPSGTSDGARSVWLWGGQGGFAPKAGELSGDSITISHDQLMGIFREGRPGAGVYLSPTRSVLVSGVTLTDADGNPLEQVEFPLIPSGEVVGGSPIEIRLSVNGD